MSTEQVMALLGGVIVALAIRLSNLLVKWLARLLQVDPPSDINDDDDTSLSR